MPTCGSLGSCCCASSITCNACCVCNKASRATAFLNSAFVNLCERPECLMRDRVLFKKRHRSDGTTRLGSIRRAESASSRAAVYAKSCRCAADLSCRHTCWRYDPSYLGKANRRCQERDPGTPIAEKLLSIASFICFSKSQSVLSDRQSVVTPCKCSVAFLATSVG